MCMAHLSHQQSAPVEFIWVSVFLHFAAKWIGANNARQQWVVCILKARCVSTALFAPDALFAPERNTIQFGAACFL